MSFERPNRATSMSFAVMRRDAVSSIDMAADVHILGCSQAFLIEALMPCLALAEFSPTLSHGMMPRTSQPAWREKTCATHT